MTTAVGQTHITDPVGMQHAFSGTVAFRQHIVRMNCGLIFYIVFNYVFSFSFT